MDFKRFWSVAAPGPGALRDRPIAVATVGSGRGADVRLPVPSTDAGHGSGFPVKTRGGGVEDLAELGGGLADFSRLTEEHCSEDTLSPHVR